VVLQLGRGPALHGVAAALAAPWSFAPTRRKAKADDKKKYRTDKRNPDADQADEKPTSSLCASKARTAKFYDREAWKCASAPRVRATTCNQQGRTLTAKIVGYSYPRIASRRLVMVSCRGCRAPQRGLDDSVAPCRAGLPLSSSISSISCRLCRSTPCNRHRSTSAGISRRRPPVRRLEPRFV